MLNVLIIEIKSRKISKNVTSSPNWLVSSLMKILLLWSMLNGLQRHVLKPVLNLNFVRSLSWSWKERLQKPMMISQSMVSWFIIPFSVESRIYISRAALVNSRTLRVSATSLYTMSIITFVSWMRLKLWNVSSPVLLLLVLRLVLFIFLYLTLLLNYIKL